MRTRDRKFNLTTQDLICCGQSGIDQGYDLENTDHSQIGANSQGSSRGWRVQPAPGQLHPIGTAQWDQIVVKVVAGVVQRAGTIAMACFAVYSVAIGDKAVDARLGPILLPTHCIVMSVLLKLSFVVVALPAPQPR